MHGAIWTYHVTDADQLLHRVREQLLPLVGEVPGFVAYYVIDAGDGVITSVTICEGEAGVEEAAVRAASWMQDNGKPLTISRPQVIEGPIAANQSSAATIQMDDALVAAASYRPGDWG